MYYFEVLSNFYLINNMVPDFWESANALTFQVTLKSKLLPEIRKTQDV